MDWAIDNINQKEINAKEAIRTINRYTCPVCGTQCILRRGNIRKPYFAHINGVASEDCENYHPGNSMYNSQNPRSRLLHFPKLYICTNNLSDWYLEILIKDYPLEEGEIYVPFGRLGQVTISIPKIKMGGIRIPVKNKEIYTLQTSDDVELSYKKIICSSIDGLDQKKYNVFNFSDDGGVKLHERNTLIWGQQYLIVWHMNLGMSGWLPDSALPQEQLNSSNQWHCKKICLPDIQDLIVEDWVCNKLNFKIKHPSLELSTIFPIPDKILDDGSLLISENNFIILSIDRNTKSEDFHELIIVSECLPLNQKKIDLCGQMPIIIAIDSLPLGRTHLWIDGEPDNSLSLYHTESIFGDYYIPGVEFTFQDCDTNQYVSFPAFCSYTAFQLEQALSGNTLLDKISLPKRTNVSIGFQRNKEEKLTEYCVSEENSHKGIEEQLKQEIIDLLGKGKLVIDFGNYGRVEVGNELRIEEKLLLTESNRKKIKWIAAQQMSLSYSLIPVEGIKTSIVLKLAKQRFIEDDYILIKKLINNQCMPPFLLPHIRSVFQEIAAQLKLLGGRKDAV